MTPQQQTYSLFVGVGLILVASVLSSNPATDRSRGTPRPSSVAVWITPAAMSSLLAKMAVGGSGLASSVRAPSIPDSNVYAPRAIISAGSGKPSLSRASPKPSSRSRVDLLPTGPVM